MQQQPNFGTAPRRVPPSLQIVNFFNGFSQVGWLLFGFGMIFFWAFVLNADFSFVTFRGPHATVDGKVTSVEETGASVNRSQVQANHYEFSVAGYRLTGVSYSTGQSVSPGELVDDRIRTTEIPCARASPACAGPCSDRACTFVSIFPLIGLVFLVFATLSGSNATACCAKDSWPTAR